MSILELFSQDEIDLILEALDHRERHYRSRIPQQEVDASSGSERQRATLERYLATVAKYQRIQSLITTEII